MAEFMIATRDYDAGVIKNHAIFDKTDRVVIGFRIRFIKEKPRLIFIGGGVQI